MVRKVVATASLSCADDLVELVVVVTAGTDDTLVVAAWEETGDATTLEEADDATTLEEAGDATTLETLTAAAIGDATDGAALPLSSVAQRYMEVSAVASQESELTSSLYAL